MVLHMTNRQSQFVQNSGSPESSFPNHGFVKSIFPQIMVSRIVVWPNRDFSESRFPGIVVCLNRRFAESRFSQIEVFQNPGFHKSRFFQARFSQIKVWPNHGSAHDELAGSIRPRFRLSGIRFPKPWFCQIGISPTKSRFCRIVAWPNHGSKHDELVWPIRPRFRRAGIRFPQIGTFPS